jgi:hypothetical protein
MRIIFVLFLAVFAFAKIEANIINVYGDRVLMDKNIKRGVSGVVICKYLNEDIICARAVADGNKAYLYPYSELKNRAFALPVVLPKKGDKIVFAKDYNRIMIFAPNQEVYLKVKNLYKSNVIISPDVFAAFLDDKVTKKDFINFAKSMDIGRYIFVIGNKIYETDAKSLYVVNEKNLNVNAKYQKAFFTYFKNFDIKPVNYLHLLKGLK